ncbi:MAG: hypothetical protein WC364_14425 [Eubacteriales bacterium]|jgi:hypothetical protein
MTAEQEKQIKDVARKIREVVGTEFTGKIMFNIARGRNEVKYEITSCGDTKQ